MAWIESAGRLLTTSRTFPWTTAFHFGLLCFLWLPSGRRGLAVGLSSPRLPTSLTSGRAIKGSRVLPRYFNLPRRTKFRSLFSATPDSSPARLIVTNVSESATASEGSTRPILVSLPVGDGLRFALMEGLLRVESGRRPKG